MQNRFAQLQCLVLVASCGGTAAQQPPPDYGFDFITINDVGNPAYDDPNPFSRYEGRGSVGYEYRIAKFETRSLQFVEFMTVLGRYNPDFAIRENPLFWGGSGFFNPDGSVGFRISSPEFADYPVAGMSWRLGALYCNWLHNGKADSPEAYLSGAYDAATFMDDPTNPIGLLDQTTRSPGARYWIPSLDE